MLTNKYLNGVPEDSRAAKESGFLQKKELTDKRLSQIKELNEIAKQRNQSLAQMAIAWLLKNERVTSVLIGASKPSQIEDSLGCLNNLEFSEEELSRIEGVLG